MRVYWLILPKAPKLQCGREAKGLNAAYDRFVGWFQGYPNIVVADAHRSGYSPSIFLDACHLDPQGASDFSRDLANVLRQSEIEPEAQHWVVLPANRESPIAGPLEVIVTSILAVQTGSRPRR